MKFSNAILTATALLMATATAMAEEKQKAEFDLVSGKPEQCISLARIDRADVIDDNNVVFYMKNDEIYRNHLPYRCAGLSIRDSFMYRTSLNQLCNVDIITVLDDIGFGFSPGPSCGLGLFHPVSEDDVRQLRERAGK